MKSIELIPITITEENFKPYGNLFTDFSKELVRITKWPQHPKGFREVSDGVSGGFTEGKFSIKWKDGQLNVVNDSVIDGDYAFASAPADATAIIQREINYHSCGSQMFFCEDHDTYLLLCSNNSSDESFPDIVDPNKFVCFKLPKCVGAHINAYIWHCPPFVSSDVSSEINVYTKQARVHSKVYYDPVREDNINFKIIFKD